MGAEEQAAREPLQRPAGVGAPRARVADASNSTASPSGGSGRGGFRFCRCRREAVGNEPVVHFLALLEGGAGLGQESAVQQALGPVLERRGDLGVVAVQSVDLRLDLESRGKVGRGLTVPSGGAVRQPELDLRGRGGCVRCKRARGQEMG